MRTLAWKPAELGAPIALLSCVPTLQIWSINEEHELDKL